MKRVFAFIGFSFAITLFLLNIIPFAAVRYITLVLVILTVIAFTVNKLRQARVLPIILCSCILACLLFSFVYTTYTSPQLALDGQKVSAELVLTSVSEKNKNFNRYKATLKSIDGEECNIKILLNARKQLSAEPYDTLEAELKLHKIGNNAFDSYGYFADGIYLSSVMGDDYIVKETDTAKPIGYHIVMLRQRIKSIVLQQLEGDEAGLAVSILTGDKDRLDDEIYNDFRICGVTHVMAVSGLHTTLICFGLYYLLKLLKCPKMLSLLLTLSFLILYISITDFTKSSIRAGIMITVLLVSKRLNGSADPLNSLGLATFLICLNPYAVFDAGAALSVTAVLGIIVILPHFRKYTENKHRPVAIVLESVFLTISVTLSMAPVMCLYFSSISLVGILLNVVFIPITQLALICVLLMLLLNKSLLLCFLPKHLARLSLALLIRIADVFADAFHWLNIPIYDNYLLIALACMLIFMGAVLVINRRLSAHMCFGILSALLIASMSFGAYNSINTVNVYCFGTGGIIASGRDTVIAVDINEYDECYTLMTENRYKQCVLIGCDKYSSELGSYFKSTVTLPKGKISENILDDRTTVSSSDDKTVITIFDNSFKISDNDVIINEIAIDRGSVADDETVVFRFSKGKEVSYSYGKIH